MINEANTVYEIRYDFELNSEEINIPEGCTLKFKGGSLNNGIINFNNTLLCEYKCIDIKFTGIIQNSNIYMSWFTNSNEIYNTDYLKQFLNACSDNIGKTLYIGKRHILVKGLSISGLSNLSIIGDIDASIIEVDPTINRKGWEICIALLKTIGLTISGIHFIAPGLEDLEGWNNPLYAVSVINIWGGKDLVVKNCRFDQMPYRAVLDVRCVDNAQIYNNILENYDGGIVWLKDEGIPSDIFNEEIDTYHIIVKDNILGGSYDWSEPIWFSTSKKIDLIVSGNIIKNKTKASGILIAISNSDSHVHITNNIIDNVDTALQLSGNGYIEITANSIFNCKTASITIKDSLTTYVTCNSIINSAATYILNEIFSGKFIFIANYVKGLSMCYCNSNDTSAYARISDNTFLPNYSGGIILQVPSKFEFSNNSYINLFDYDISNNAAFRLRQPIVEGAYAIVKRNNGSVSFDQIANNNPLTSYIDCGSWKKYMRGASLITTEGISGINGISAVMPGFDCTIRYKYTGTNSVIPISKNCGNIISPNNEFMYPGDIANIVLTQQDEKCFNVLSQNITRSIDTISIVDKENVSHSVADLLNDILPSEEVAFIKIRSFDNNYFGVSIDVDNSGLAYCTEQIDFTNLNSDDLYNNDYDLINKNNILKEYSETYTLPSFSYCYNYKAYEGDDKQWLMPTNGYLQIFRLYCGLYKTILTKLGKTNVNGFIPFISNSNKNSYYSMVYENGKLQLLNKDRITNISVIPICLL